jgi:CheY-like chemotaxis protein
MGEGSSGLSQIMAPSDNIDADSLNLSGADDLIDAWFVDGNMPVMDGVELTRRLRSAGVRAPILAVTGNALAEDQVAFRQAGASTVLTKPCSSEQLHETLSRIGCGAALG